MTEDQFSIARAKREEQAAAARQRDANMKRIREDGRTYVVDIERNLAGIERARRALRRAH